jgi:hypothetical protein
MDEASYLSHTPPFDDFYTSTQVQRFEPVTGPLIDPFRRLYEFQINIDEINKHIRFADLSITISIVQNDDNKFITVAGPGLTVHEGAVTTSLSNNILYTLFQNQKVYLNNENISESYNMHHIQAYLYNLFSLSGSAQNSISHAWGFYDDADQIVTTTKQNPGFKSRNALLKNSRRIVLKGPILSSIFMQNTPLIASNIKIELERNNFERILQTEIDGGLKVRIEDIAIYLGISTIRDVYAAKMYKNLMVKPQQYFLNDTEMNYFTLNKGITNFKQRLFCKTRPELILVTFQPLAVFNGNYDTNIYKFTDPGLTQMYFLSDSIKYPLGLGYSFDTVDKSYVDSYKNLHDNIGLDSLNFSLENYPKNYFILGTDFTSEFGYSKHVRRPLKNFDNIVLYLDFLNKLTQDWVVIIANYFSKTVTVNALKQSIVSY